MKRLNSLLWPTLIIVGIAGMTDVGCRRSQSPQPVTEPAEIEAVAETAAAEHPRPSAFVEDARIDNIHSADQAASPPSARAREPSPPIDQKDQPITRQPSTARWLIHSDRVVLAIDVTSSWKDQTQTQRSRENLQQITQLCDSNQDGTTSWDELSNFADLFPRPSGSDTLPLEFLRSYDTNGNDTVDSPELLQFLARGQLIISGWLAIRVDRRFLAQRDSPTLRWLDEDGDGYLNSSEIENASRRLSQIDADGDNLIWTTDWAPWDMVSASAPNQPFITLTNTQQYVCQIDDSTDWNQLAFDLEQRFSFERLVVNDVPRDSVLTRLDQHHGDGNSEISIRELQQLAAIQPDLSIHLHWHPPKLSLAADEVSTPQGHLRATIGGVPLDLSMQSPPSPPPEFNSVDIDHDLSDEIARNLPPMSVPPLTFEAVDDDNNGSIDETEYESATTIDHLIHGVFVNARIFRSLDPLFTLIDQNRDGRLDRREMNAASKQLGPPGNTSQREIDSRNLAAGMAIDFSTGFATGNAGLPSSPSDPAQPDPDRPRWFTAMDLDDNGEIDAVEFIGPLATFETLDTNNDGCVDLHELKPQ